MGAEFKTARTHLGPLATCIAASLALGLLPFLYGKHRTGDWSAPNQIEVQYYLQLAAQPYFGRSAHLTDPSVAGGPVFYSWLQFVPAAYFARVFGLRVFSIAILWTVFAAAGLAASAYGLFWYF